MTTCQRLLGFALMALLACAMVSGAVAENFSLAPKPESPAWPWASQTPNLTQADFGGTLRLYVVEPDARWKDYDGNGYHFGFIDLPLDSAVSLNSGDRIVLSRTWLASSSGLGGFSEQNIMVVAGLVGDDPHQAYSYPPSGYPFTAYYGEAGAAARPGEVDSNHTTANSTHTIIAEEPTATWCGYCPTMSYWMNYVYTSGAYNFYFISFVTDKVAEALSYTDNRFNVYGYPVCYFDGGYRIILGGQYPATPYTTALTACGARAVDGAGLMIKTEWLNANGDLGIEVVLALDVPVNQAPTVGVPEGEIRPLPQVTYEYSAMSSDPENEDCYFMFDWGDGQTSPWYGPHPFGEPCVASHAWSSLGTYDVIVRCRDKWLAESEVSTPLTVTVGCCVGIRGNVNGDATNGNVADLTFLVNYLFKGGAVPPCIEEANINGTSPVNVADLTYLVNFLFKGGPAPLACP